MPRNLLDDIKPENLSTFEPKSEPVDPNFTMNEAVFAEIQKRNERLLIAKIVATSALTLVTAPLHTLHVSMQLSVLAHKNKYGDVTDFEDRKAIAKASREVTIQDRRKFELLVKSGITGSNKPFRAPVYGSYMEAARALMNQGPLAFYKGNLVGMAGFAMNTTIRFRMFESPDVSRRVHHSELVGRLGYVLISCSPLAIHCNQMLLATFFAGLADIITHPIGTIQSRFILQNRLPGFYAYKSIFHFFKKHRRQVPEVMQGWKGHWMRNLLMSAGAIGISEENPIGTLLLGNFISTMLGYPLLTAIRRLQCQSDLPGMLPARYEGCWHALKLIQKEEGIRGLYRGCIAHLAGSSLANIGVLIAMISAQQRLSNQAAY